MAREPTADPWERLKTLPMGQRLEIVDDGGRRWSGTIVPRHEFSAERILQLKLESGYNVGVLVTPRTTVRLIGTIASPVKVAGSTAPSKEPGSVVLLTTGGTIASRVDYTTGGVRPVEGEAELLAFYPELAREGVRVVPVLDKLSENLTPHDWTLLAERVANAFQEGARGIVIAHGTDTMGFTAAALSFLLPDLPGPVVLVGAQRSPDRPSSDGASNLAAAVRLAKSAMIGEVVVAMHEGTSDVRFAIHRGTRVRKMHSTRRDAFRSRNGPPLGFIENGTVHLDGPVRPPSLTPVRVDGPLDDSGRLLWAYPGLSAGAAEEFVRGSRGVIIAGTGLGHVAQAHLDWIGRAIDSGLVVGMTTQCLEGIADPFVYATGRELQRVGVTYLGDLLPETAYVKLLWALGRARDPAEVRRWLLTDRAGEFSARRQDGTPG